MKVYKKPRKSIVEVVDDAGKSVLRYRGHDRKLRYVASSDSPEGGGGGAEAPLVEVTHAELKAMRDGGKLTAGALYRITDYNCTTTQENTQSAGHQFDIVLLALSEDKLAEEGWAMMHENDTYFANSNLSAWKVWYCLDNDKSRFAWADDNLPSIVDEDVTYVRKPSSDIGDLFAWYNENDNIYDYTKTEHPSIGDETFDEEGGTNANVSNVFGFGRGVIYRLIDEWDNDVPYDFKNIMFTDDVAYYTFNVANANNPIDASLSSATSNNKISTIFDYGINVLRAIPVVVFAIQPGYSIYGNIVENGMLLVIILGQGNILRNMFRICMDTNMVLSEENLIETIFLNCSRFSLQTLPTSPIYINNTPVVINS